VVSNGGAVWVVSVQIQKLKLDVQVAMLELDQVLRSNEINFGVMAALPALLLAAALLYALRQATRPKVSPLRTPPSIVSSLWRSGPAQHKAGTSAFGYCRCQFINSTFWQSPT
jgi:hypothetical protein